MKQQIGKEEFLKLWTASLPYNNIFVLNESTLHTKEATSLDENVKPFSRKRNQVYLQFLHIKFSYISSSEIEDSQIWTTIL